MIKEEFQDSMMQIVTKPTDPPLVHKSSNAEEFKKFLLACMWDKRIPKQEMLLMNLVQNIKTLSQAVKDDSMPLKTALKVLIGL
jgi:hypothetical protein